MRELNNSADIRAKEESLSALSVECLPPAVDAADIRVGSELSGRSVAEYYLVRKTLVTVDQLTRVPANLRKSVRTELAYTTLFSLSRDNIKLPQVINVRVPQGFLWWRREVIKEVKVEDYAARPDDYTCIALNFSPDDVIVGSPDTVRACKLLGERGWNMRVVPFLQGGAGDGPGNLEYRVLFPTPPGDEFDAAINAIVSVVDILLGGRGVVPSTRPAWAKWHPPEPPAPPESESDMCFPSGHFFLLDASFGMGAGGGHSPCDK